MRISRRNLLWSAAGVVVAGTGTGVVLDSLTAHDPRPAEPPAPAHPRPQAERPVEIGGLTPVGAATKPAYRVRDLRPDAPHDAIALTIDDGPDPHWTPHVLDLLEKLRIRATFSLVGMHVHEHHQLVRRIIGSGHGICNHSMTHPEPFARKPKTTVLREITDAQNAIVEIGGQAPRLFRSPGGDWSADVFATIANYGMRPIDWNVDPRDWARPGIPFITKKLLAARPGDIVLCHDGGGDRAETLAALRTVLPQWKARGYRFTTL